MKKREKVNWRKFGKPNGFYLSVTRRITHSFYRRKDSPTLAKFLKKLKEEIDSACGRTRKIKTARERNCLYRQNDVKRRSLC